MLTSEEFRRNPMFLRNQFQGDGVFELPIIKKTEIDLKDVMLIGYDKTKDRDKKNQGAFVHFFLDDYKFEVLWNDPEPRLGKLKQYRGVRFPPTMKCRSPCSSIRRSALDGAEPTCSQKD